jgi:hypothetical protein
MFRQFSAQSRHAIAHSSMSPIFSQLSAHASQMSQQMRQIGSLNVELLNRKFDEVWHISAQFIIRRKCSGWTCLPPESRHCVIAVCKQIWWQILHASMHESASWLLVIVSGMMAPLRS